MCPTRRYLYLLRLARETRYWSSRKLRMTYSQAWRVEEAKLREQNQ